MRARTGEHRRLGAGLVGFGLLAASAAHAAWVFPPGQEAALEAALRGDASGLAGCQYSEARIDKAQVTASYTCPSGPQTVQLRHVGAAEGEGSKAGTFFVVGTSPLQQAVAARLAAPEAAALHWTEAVVKQEGEAPVATPANATSTVPPLPPEIERRYRATDAVMMGERPWELFDDILVLVRQYPHPVLMGRLVVACAGIASSQDGQRRVDALMDDARAHPDDPLRQFIAGVSAHYRGHVRGASREAKTADYQRALSFLEPLREVYADSPRLWIYLAVSYARTGQQAKAEDAIEHALRFDEKTDADIYYCEAEVWHKKDPKRALRAIERYQALMRAEAPNGAWHGPGKAEKVEHMRQVMQRVVDGQPLGDEDMYDPVQDWAKPTLSKPWVPWLAGLGAVAAVGLLGWLLRRRKRPNGVV